MTTFVGSSISMFHIPHLYLKYSILLYFVVLIEAIEKLHLAQYWKVIKRNVIIVCHSSVYIHCHIRVPAFILQDRTFYKY